MVIIHFNYPKKKNTNEMLLTEQEIYTAGGVMTFGWFFNNEKIKPSRIQPFFKQWIFDWQFENTSWHVLMTCSGLIHHPATDKSISV